MRFGIELEFTGMKRAKCVQLLEKFFNTNAVACTAKTEDKYTYHKVEDMHGDFWIVKRDRSIVPRVDGNETLHYNTADETLWEYMVELVSPVLTEETLPLLYEIVEIIKKAGGVVNSSCGMHVHIDSLPLDDTVNLFSRFIENQDKILEEFAVESGRKYKYCKPYKLPTNIIPTFNNFDEFFSWLWQNFRDLEVDRDTAIELSKSLRYFALNFYSLLKTHTLEYRFFNGTLDINEIARNINWVTNFTYNNL